MRGIYRLVVEHSPRFGIIPAGAGHFSSRRTLPLLPWDHPRMCGAIPGLKLHRSCFWGSSPQVRGISVGFADHVRYLRIIPAGAGHFKPGSVLAIQDPDHPRRCGAFPVAKSVDEIIWGSSPQVRGICSTATARLEPLGIIPAGAGHLLSSGVSSSGCSDHPRRCGAFASARATRSTGSGSSPQVRGIFDFAASHF